MALSRSDIAGVRRQLRPVRTEPEVAADVLMRLFDQDLLRTSPQVMANVAAATGVPVPALREAKRRADQRGYLLPTDTCAISAVPGDPKGRTFHSEETARAQEAGRAKGTRNSIAVTSKQPAPGATHHACRQCKCNLPIANFATRTDAPHRIRLSCRDCWAAMQRRRYLSVAKESALNEARLTFELRDVDDRVGLRCVGCGKPFAPGDHVTGSTALAHVVCEPAPNP